MLAIDEVIAFVKKHAMHGIEIKSARHTEAWSLPLTVIREAVINAIVHADYAQLGSPIRLINLIGKGLVIEISMGVNDPGR